MASCSLMSALHALGKILRYRLIHALLLIFVCAYASYTLIIFYSTSSGQQIKLSTEFTLTKPFKQFAEKDMELPIIMIDTEGILKA